MKEKIAIGTIRKGSEIGHKDALHSYILVECEVCKVRHWVYYYKKLGGSKYTRCHHCSKYSAPNPCPNPKLGDICMGKDIGKSKSTTYIWDACEICHKERWVIYRDGKPMQSRCIHCGKHTELNPCTNPQFGDIRRGKDIGFNSKGRWKWTPCINCGTGFWLSLKKCVKHSGKCVSCLYPKDINPCPNPKIGDIRRGRDLGFEGTKNQKYIWHACIGCGKARWVQVRSGIVIDDKCGSCACKRPPNPCKNPQEGDIRYGRDLGRSPTGKYIYSKCSICNTGDWRRVGKDGSISKRCTICALSKRYIVGGYVRVSISKSSPYYQMADKDGLVIEHRLVMAKHLGRCLQSNELVHHKDGNKLNNDIGNLEITSKGKHIVDHSKGYRDGYAKGLIDGRDKQVAELKDTIDNQTKLIKLLQWQITNIHSINNI
jgi:hypothetical protein